MLDEAERAASVDLSGIPAGDRGALDKRRPFERLLRAIENSQSYFKTSQKETNVGKTLERKRMVRAQPQNFLQKTAALVEILKTSGDLRFCYQCRATVHFNASYVASIE